MTPQRIQLRRTRGWRMPPNTVKVDRSTKWGNPFTVQFCRAWFQLGPTAARAKAVEMYRAWLGGQLDDEWVDDVPPTDLSPLAGKSLGCWCPIGAPCHADVLLEIANG